MNFQRRHAIAFANLEEPVEKDPRYEDKSPHMADEQDQPEPERPTTPTEKRLDGPEDKPSQAEGERDSSAE
jgi:hypothetical protein